jgi:hypothetical protein
MIKDITKDMLLALGFVEEFSSPEESGEKDGYYYYCFEIDNETILISDTNTDNDGYFTIEFFNNETIKITEAIDLTNLINVLKRCTVRNYE